MRGKGIVPFSCEECGRQFGETDGGICRECGRVLQGRTAVRHLRAIRSKGNQQRRGGWRMSPAERQASLDGLQRSLAIRRSRVGRCAADLPRDSSRLAGVALEHTGLVLRNPAGPRCASAGSLRTETGRSSSIPAHVGEFSDLPPERLHHQRVRPGP